MISACFISKPLSVHGATVLIFNTKIRPTLKDYQKIPLKR